MFVCQIDSRLLIVFSRDFIIISNCIVRHVKVLSMLLHLNAYDRVQGIKSPGFPLTSLDEGNIFFLRLKVYTTRDIYSRNEEMVSEDLGK